MSSMAVSALRAAPASSASRCAPRHRRATGQTAAAQPRTRTLKLPAAPKQDRQPHQARTLPGHSQQTGHADPRRTGDHQHTSVACPGRGKQSINRAITGRPGAAVISPRQSHHLSGIDRTFGRGFVIGKGTATWRWAVAPGLVYATRRSSPRSPASNRARRCSPGRVARQPGR